MESRENIITTINHSRIEISGEKAFMTLATFLRSEIGLTGTKVVCAEGDCGACTVLFANQFDDSGKLVFKAVNACILPIYLIDGAQIITVEGLKKEDELSIVQKSMVDNNGAQCGYCTPGFICAMSGMVEKLKNENKPITEKRVKNYLSGNLCRCTGYKPIIEAGLQINISEAESLTDRYGTPAWLAEMKSIQKKSVNLKCSDKQIFLPTTLTEALEAKKNKPKMRIIAGATDLGVVMNKGKVQMQQALALFHIEELKKISVENKYLMVGATVSLSEFEDYLQKHVPEVARILHIFASLQIKNQATLVGNIVNASPIGDMIPFLMISEAVICIQNTFGHREVNINYFYQGYKKLDLRFDEIVVAIKIPLPTPDEAIKLYKMSMRKDLDISAVTFAGLIKLDNNKKISQIKLALGGVGPTVMRLSTIEKNLIGEDFSREAFINVAKSLPEYISPLDDLRASKKYRMLLSQNFIKKFFDEVSGL